MGTNRYIDDHTTLFVQDGDTAYASDVNNIATITNIACDRIQAEMETYLVDTETHMNNASAYSVSAFDSSVSAANNRDLTSGFMDTTSGFMNTTSGFMDTTSGFMDTTSGFMDNASGYSVSAYNSSVSAYNSYTSGVTLYSGISGAVTGVNAVSGISGSVANNVLSIRHTDTSSQADVNSTTSQAVKSLSFDGYGHVTAAAIQTITPANIGAALATHYHNYLPLSGGTMSGPVTLETQQIRYGSSGTPYLTFASNYWKLGVNTNEHIIFSNIIGLVARFSDLIGAPTKGFSVAQGDTIYGSFGVSSLGEAEIYGSTAAILRAGSRQVLVDSAAFFPWITTLNLGKNDIDFAWNNIYYTGTSNDISDERLKDISGIGDVSWLYNVDPISFVWKDGDDKRIRFGFGAQSLYEILPERLKDNSGIVAKDFDEKKNDYNWAVSKTELIAPMIKLIQEQKAMIDDLTARVTALEGGK